MDETEFLAAAETLFCAIEDALERADYGIEAYREGNALTLECENGTQVVLNIHAVTSEVWLASRERGTCFSYVGSGLWRNTRQEDQEFWPALSYALSRSSGIDVKLP